MEPQRAKQIGTSWLFKASYMGNNTVHLWTDREINPAIYVPGATTVTTQARRRLTQLNPTQGPLYGTVELLDDGGTGSYNALIMSAEHRLSNHFMVLANYTWSHCISDLVTSELSGPIYTNPANRRGDRGNCTQIDTRGNFNLSAVVQSPHMSSRVLQWVAGDWQLSPIVTAHTGGYFNVTTGVDNALNGIGGQRPNQLVNDPYCAHQSISCWMNLTGTFAAPAAGTFGNFGYNNLVGPGFFEIDLALSKRFRVREHQSAEIRAESFNIQNRANFLNPTAAMNSSNFGKILTDVSPRIMQFAIKYAF